MIKKNIFIILLFLYWRHTPCIFNILSPLHLCIQVMALGIPHTGVHMVVWGLMARWAHLMAPMVAMDPMEI